MKYLAALVALVALIVPATSVAEAPNDVITESRVDTDGSIVTFTMTSPAPQAGGCGYKLGEGTVKKTNPYGVVLWTWRAYVKVGYCNYKVITVPYFYSQPIDSCCSWDYKGQIGRKITGVGSAAVDLYIKGQFQACIGVVISYCDTDYPWISATVNGNGITTKSDWGY